jgi:hypothetical protein
MLEKPFKLASDIEENAIELADDPLIEFDFQLREDDLFLESPVLLLSLL